MKEFEKCVQYKLTSVGMDSGCVKIAACGTSHKLLYNVSSVP